LKETLKKKSKRSKKKNKPIKVKNNKSKIIIMSNNFLSNLFFTQGLDYKFAKHEAFLQYPVYEDKKKKYHRICYLYEGRGLAETGMSNMLYLTYSKSLIILFFVMGLIHIPHAVIYYLNDTSENIFFRFSIANLDSKSKK
jgi:hypothetical protein